MATLLDLQAAFRMVPVLASEWELLGMYWRDKYYVETCLPFVLHSAPSIFDNFASALHWILEHNYGATLLHYLDDFLLLWLPGLPTCQDSMSTMLRVCQELGMLVAMEKSVGPAICLTFLGIELDSSLQQLRLPLTKLQDITSLTKSWLGKRSSTKRELLSLIGKLAFAAKIVPAGRLFLHCLIHLSTTARSSIIGFVSTQMPELMLHGGIGFCHPGMVSPCLLLPIGEMQTPSISTLTHPVP